MTRTRVAPGMVHIIDLVGVPPVSRAQAAANLARRVHPMTNRPGRPGLVSLDAASLWRMVKAGRFPPPSRGPWGLAWPLDAIYRWRRHNQK